MSSSQFYRSAQLLRIFSALSLGFMISTVHAQTAVEMVGTASISGTLDAASLNTPKVKTPVLSDGRTLAETANALSAEEDPVNKGQVAAIQPINSELSAQLTQGRDLLSATADTPEARTEQLTQARQIFEQLIAQQYRVYDSHFALGLALYQLGDYPGARFEFAQIATLAPDRMEGQYNLAVVLARQGDQDAALAAYQKAIDAGIKEGGREAALLQAYRNIININLAKSDYASATKNLTSALALQPADSVLAISLAESVFKVIAPNLATGKTEQLTEVAQILDLAYKVLKTDPSNTRAALLIADVYARQGLNDRALRELDTVLAQNTEGLDSAALYRRKAEILFDADRAADALVAYQKASEVAPADFASQYLYGKILLENDQYPEAQKAFEAAALADTSSAEAWIGVALAQEAQNQFAPSYASANKGLALAKTNDNKALAGLVAGRNAYRTGQYGVAQRTLQGVSNLKTTTDVWLWLGLSSYALKNYKVAATQLEQAQRLDPSNPLVQANLGAAYLAATRYSDAQVMFQTVVNANPDNAAAWYNLGWAFRNLGREHEARVAFKKALALGYTRAKEALAK